MLFSKAMSTTGSFSGWGISVPKTGEMENVCNYFWGRISNFQPILNSKQVVRIRPTNL